MIHISRTKKGQFINAVVSDVNGKVIMTSEPLKSIRNARRNIVSMMSNSEDATSWMVQDNTGSTPVVFELFYTGKIRWEATRKAKKPYQPK